MNAAWFQPPWKRALVYGLGVSGLAAARLLRAREIDVVGVDRRPESELDLGSLSEDRGLAVVAESDAQTLPDGVDGVVVSPGVPSDKPILVEARAAGVPVIGEIELAAACLTGELVAITGSNGKSTTTALAGALLEAGGFEVEVVGNIGIPLSDRAVDDPDRIYVAELSSFQLEGIEEFRARTSALLNLSDDHLDRHGDFEGYASAKGRIFENQVGEDIAILNGDDENVVAMSVPARRRLFSRRAPVDDGCWFDGDRVVEVRPGKPEVELFRRSDLTLSGVHNLENAMAAALVARSFEVEPRSLQQGLQAFRGLPHRLELVASHAEVEFYDDSKGTNVGATVRSLEGFDPGSVHLILGGRAKGASFGDLREPVARACRRVYLVGEAAVEIEHALAAVVPMECAVNLPAAVARAAESAEPGDVVLLSPACASFDQYRNFAARGEHFQELVDQWVEGVAHG